MDQGTTSQLNNHCGTFLQGVDSLEEVREVGGELYSKVSLVDRTIIQPITNTADNYTTQVVLRSGHLHTGPAHCNNRDQYIQPCLYLKS